MRSETGVTKTDVSFCFIFFSFFTLTTLVTQPALSAEVLFLVAGGTRPELVRQDHRL